MNTPRVANCKKCDFEFLVNTSSPEWRKNDFCSELCMSRYICTTETTSNEPPISLNWISTEDAIIRDEPYLNEDTTLTKRIFNDGPIECPVSREKKVELDDFQLEQAKWSFKNFGKRLGPERCYQPLAEVTKEVGELSHIILQLSKRVRNNQNSYENGQIAVGNVVIGLLSICNRMGWSFNDCLTKTWNTVEQKEQ